MNKPRLQLPVAALYFLCLSPLPAPGQESERQYLSGRGKDDAVPWKFLCTAGVNSGQVTTIPVPSNWELHGFGTLSYGRDSTNAWGERGLYEHDFAVPASWSGKHVFLVFEGVMTDTEVKINGVSAGPIHQGGFYRFKYEISKFIKFGATNFLEVIVDKRSADSSVNRAERTADYWIFGGIYRPVYLEAVPRQFIERVAIDARADGAFAMDVFLNGVTDATTVEAQITSTDGKPVGKPFVWNSVVRQSNPPKAGVPDAILSTKIPAPLTWTAETPNLYFVEVRLKRTNDVLHTYRQRFGFRTMEVRDGDGLYVNGRRVILKGVNRHSSWPDSGRCLSEAVHRWDIEVMKDMNMNAVRMSHYPPDEQFLDLCDELGLYVLDELAGWQKFYDTGIGRKLVEEMIVRDVNHPSILFWCNGNEGGFNTNLDNVYLQFDPQQRRVIHPWASFNGLCTAHYLAYDKARIAATGQSVYYHRGQELVATNDTTKYIYMPTEFLHGLYDGGAGAGFEDNWKLLSESPLCGGAFFWVLADEGIRRPNTGAIDVAGNAAPDGIVGPYREKEGSFYAIKEIWSPIVVAPDETGTLMVENRYNFLDANKCSFVWQLRKFPAPRDVGKGFTVLSEGKTNLQSIVAGGTGPLKIKLPPGWQEADALAVRADDPGGRELWTWVWPMRSNARYSGTTPSDTNEAQGEAPVVAAFSDGHSIVINAGDLTVNISKDTGFLTSIARGSQTFSLTNGPRPAAGSAKLTKITHKRDAADYVVTATFTHDLRNVTWRVQPNGWIKCDYTYAAEGPQDFHGVVFDYPENLVKSKRWLGDGPYRVWKNRLRGATLNVWQNDYNNTITGYRDWIYPEFKGCFANVRWMQLETAEGPITVVPEQQDIFVQVLTPAQPPDTVVANTKVKLSQCGLGLLHAIPPIGTKFKEARHSGPQSELTVANGEYSGSVSFYFGKLP